LRALGEDLERGQQANEITQGARKKHGNAIVRFDHDR
jgi:hypothetical protein